VPRLVRTPPFWFAWGRGVHVSKRGDQALLEAWRAAERSLRGVDPDAIEWENRNACVERAREAYLRSATPRGARHGLPPGFEVTDRRERIISLLIEDQGQADETDDAYRRLLGRPAHMKQREGAAVDRQ
jgi:hypothetical protein